MADVDRIKRNINKMISQGAPESDIDQYVASEGVTAEQLRATKSQPVGTGEDMARAGAAGVGRGIASLPGSFGDVAQINSDVTSWALGKLGAPEWAQSAGGTAAKYMSGPWAMLPGSDTYVNAISAATKPQGGESFIDYKPQTVAGDYTKTLGEFAPSTLLGPSRMGTKIATGAAAALGSETAGQLTKDTAAEPYARFAGAVIGGAAPNMRSPKNAILKNAPSPADVKQQTNAAYDAVRAADIVYDPNAYSQFVNNLGQSLMKEGIDKTLHPKAFRALERVAELDGAAPTYQDVETLRRVAGDVLKTNDRSEYRMASRILGELDNLEASGAFVSNAGYNPDQVRALTTKARELGRRNAILGDMSEMDRKSGWYVSGDESGIRNQIASYGKSSKGKRMTAEESAAFDKVVRREGVQNLGSTLGGRFSLAALPGTLATAGGVIGGIPGAVTGFGLGLAGNLGARKGMEALSSRAWNKAKQTVALGKKGQQRLNRAKKVSLPPSIVPRLGLFGMVPAQAYE